MPPRSERLGEEALARPAPRAPTPLSAYRAKRNFTTTPEPPGDRPAPPRRGPRFFCVQKHLASHLHYDLRLEHEGVLRSWAVPRGPSLDPADRRFAVQVEDHPLEYGTFEGIIPEGYGAGIVMLWDRGTWTPEVEDVDAALRKGDLKFALDGYKLKGSWVLARMRGGDGRNWLLIKHRDEWSGALDITAFAPRSVKSAGDFEDILAAGRPDVWTSNRPARAGATGALLERIIERAAALKAAGRRQGGRSGRPPAAPRPERKVKSAGSAKAPAGGRGTRPAAKASGARTAKKTVARRRKPGERKGRPKTRR